MAEGWASQSDHLRLNPGLRVLLTAGPRAGGGIETFLVPSLGNRYDSRADFPGAQYFAVLSTAPGALEALMSGSCDFCKSLPCLPGA